MSTIKVDTYLTRGGASEIAIDKLKGASSAGSMTVVAEGGTVTTNLQQGLCKAWTKSGSDSTRLDSFNMDGSNDVSTGKYTYSLVNPFSSTSYAIVGMGNSTDRRRNVTELGTSAATDTLSVETSDAGTVDNTAHSVTAHGDLA